MQKIFSKGKSKKYREVAYVFFAILVAFSIGSLVKVYIFSMARIDGESMTPTFRQNDLLLVSKLPSQIKSGDIVTFILPQQPAVLTKRIIAVGPAKVFINNYLVFVNDKIFLEAKDSPPFYDDDLFWCRDSEVFDVPEGYFFVLGDNRCFSLDSRYLGPIRIEQITGIVKARLFPSFKSF